MYLSIHKTKMRLTAGFSVATERSGAIFAICLTLLLWSTSSLAQLQATVDGQAPPNPVTFGDSISYTITITNADPANGAIGNGVQIFVDGVLQPASAGDWQVTSAIGQTPSCSVDSAFPSAWACFDLDSNLSSFTHEFTWLQPEAGNHDIRFRIFGQRPIDNNGIDFDFDLFAQTSVIGANQAPVIDLIGLNQVVAEGASLVIPLNATDPDPNDTLTFSQSGLPAFCNLTDNGDGTGSITCNPASGDAGTSNVLVTVTDDGTPPLSDSDRFVLTVTANQPPVLEPIGSQTVIEGNALSIPLSATDPDPSDTLTFSQSGLPAFCSLTDNGNGTGAIACSPAPGDAGTYNVTVTVTDDGGLPQSDSESFLLTVEQVVSQPLTATLNDQQPANPVPIGTSVAYTITTTNIDPAGGTIGTGVFVYVDGALQPANAGEFSANGCSVDSAFPSAWACNNLTAAAPQQTYTLTWLAPAAGTHNMRFEVIGQRPIDNIGPPDFSINLERQTVIDSNSPVVNITAPSVVNDTDGQPGEDVQVTGSAIDVEDGALPPTSFRWFVNNTEIVNVAGQEAPTLRLPDGVNTVGLEATDSDSLSTRIDVEITVNAPPSSTNDSPILGAIGNLTVPEGELLDVAIAASDPNPNDVLAFTQTGLPSFCSFTDNGDGTGSIACNPSLGDAGTYSVTVTVTDDGNPRLSDAETFSLVVEEVAAPAVSVIAAGSSDVAISVEDTDGLAGETIQVTGSATDPQDGELPPDSFRWFVNGTEVTEAAGQATAALALDDGDNTIEFEATDSDNNTTRTSVTVSVAQPAFADGPISDRPGLTPNETETAVGLEDTCGNIIEVGNPTQEQQDLLALCATLASDESSDADVAETLNAISGEQITSQKATSIDFASVQLSNVGSRITALRTLGLRGSRGVSTAGLNLDISVDGKPVPVYAVAEVVKGLLRGGGASADGAETDGQSDTSSSSSILNPKLGIFINGNIAFGDKDPTTNETGFDFDSTGLTFGMDYLFTDHFVAGIALGYANAEAKFFGNTGEQSSDFYSGTLFGTIMHDKWFVAGIGGIANGDYDTIRRISGPLLSQDEVASGTTDGNNLFGGLSAEFDFGRGQWRFGPAVAINYIEADIDGFAESGAGALDLVYGDQTAKSLTMKAGLRLGYVFTTGFGVLSLDGRGDFVREYENDSQIIRVNFVNDPFVNDPSQPSPGFTVLTDEPDKDYGLWGLSLSYQGPHSISGFVDYQSVTGMSGMTLSEITVGLRIQKQFD